MAVLKAVYLLNRLFNCDDCAVIEDRIQFNNGDISIFADYKENNGFKYNRLV